MLNNNEKGILLAIKILPILIVIILSAVVTYLFTVQNQDKFEKEIHDIREDFIRTNKLNIRIQVEKMSQIIENEKRDSSEHLQRHIKNEVLKAHTIASNIYEKNKNLEKKQLKKLIADALRGIRYDNGKGYLFINTMKGVNVLHPIKPALEGVNLWEHKDIKGVKILQEMIPLLKENKETYYQWWWSKPNNTKEFKKTGYLKIFEPFDWFIGTGLYEDDYKKDLKHTILHYLKNISTEKDGYLFILNKEGEIISNNYYYNLGTSDKNNFISTNKEQGQIRVTDEIIRHLLRFAKKGDGFTTYNISKLNEKIESKKISYIKNIKEYDWILGYGFHPKDIERKIKAKELSLERENKAIIVRMFFINVVVTIFLIIILILFSDFVKKQFIIYRNENRDYQNKLHTLIDEKTLKLEKLNKTLEEKVIEEVAKNRDKDKILFQQSKMAAMGELLAMIAHQWRQPLAQINSTTLNMYNNYKKGHFSLELLKKDITEIENTTNFLSQTITDFSTFFTPEKEKIVFSTQQAVAECLHILFPKFIHRVNVEIDIKEDTNINGHITQYQQAVLTILINALDMFEERHIEFPAIKINIDSIEGKSKLSISDNAQGINKDSLDKIFEAYYSTKKSKKNSGLGLHISKMIIEQNMNGKLNVENTQKGAKFTIII